MKKDFLKKAKSTVESRRFSMTTITVLVIALAMFVNALLYALDEKVGLSVIRPSSSEITLSGATDTYFDDVKDLRHVTLTFCMPEDELSSHTTGAYVLRTAKQLAERYPGFITLRFVNIITKRDADGNAVDLTRYQTDETGEEVSITKTTVIFESTRHFRVLTDTYSTAGFADFFTLNSSGKLVAYNGEEVLAAMIRFVLADEHKTAYFTNYHGETADLALRTVLATAGYYIKDIDLRENEIPDDAGLVLISAPQSDFEQGAAGSGVRSEIDRLSDYVENGGNLYVALHSYLKRDLPVFGAFLEKYGLRVATTDLTGGQTVQNIVKDADRAITTDGFTFSARLSGEAGDDFLSRVGRYSENGVLVAHTGRILPADNVTPLLVTSSAAVTEAGGAGADGAGSYTVAAVAAVDGAGGTGHIFLSPSIYLSASDALTSTKYANRDFLFSLFESYFGAGKMPYGTTLVNLSADLLENLTMQTAKIYTAIIAVIPAALCVFAVIYLYRRKNR
ncbi:MAG TPA: hypothetical protein DDY70_02745 [Clostridiales bacterium]|nr:hypothetical protein [Clostridiales bacterium]